MHTPTPGQHYYHYKHDPAQGADHHLYEIIAIGWDTEHEEEVVIYKPLYPSEHLATTQAAYYVRPVRVFCGFLEDEGCRRFVQKE